VSPTPDEKKGGDTHSARGKTILLTERRLRLLGGLTCFLSRRRKLNGILGKKPLARFGEVARFEFPEVNSLTSGKDSRTGACRKRETDRKRRSPLVIDKTGLERESSSERRRLSLGNVAGLGEGSDITRGEMPTGEPGKRFRRRELCC